MRATRAGDERRVVCILCCPGEIEIRETEGEKNNLVGKDIAIGAARDDDRIRFLRVEENRGRKANRGLGGYGEAGTISSHVCRKKALRRCAKAMVQGAPPWPPSAAFILRRWRFESGRITLGRVADQAVTRQRPSLTQAPTYQSPVPSPAVRIAPCNWSEDISLTPTRRHRGTMAGCEMSKDGGRRPRSRGGGGALRGTDEIRKMNRDR